MRPIKRSAIRFDIDTESAEKSDLDDSTRGLIADLADASMYEREYKTIGQDYQAVPFGRINRAEVEKAKSILDKLALLSTVGHI